MAQCKAKTKSGRPCNVPALKGSRYCFTHDPSNGKARSLAHKKGGKNRRVGHHAQGVTIPKEVKTLEDANKILVYTLAEILPMENSLMRARVLLALYDSFIKSFEIGEFELRLAALEEINKQQASVV